MHFLPSDEDIRRGFGFFSAAFSDGTPEHQSNVSHQSLNERNHVASTDASPQSLGPLTGKLEAAEAPPPPQKPAVTWPEAEAAETTVAGIGRSCWRIHNSRNRTREGPADL